MEFYKTLLEIQEGKKESMREKIEKRVVEIYLQEKGEKRLAVEIIEEVFLRPYLSIFAKEVIRKAD